MKICISCKNKFEPNRPDKKFCSGRCRARYNSEKRYLIVGKTRKYKKEARRRFNLWLRKNRKKHNEVMKKYIRERCRTPEFKAKRKIYYAKNKDKINKRIRKNRRLKLKND